MLSYELSIVLMLLSAVAILLAASLITGPRQDCGEPPPRVFHIPATSKKPFRSPHVVYSLPDWDEEEKEK